MPALSSSSARAARARARRAASCLVVAGCLLASGAGRAAAVATVVVPPVLPMVGLDGKTASAEVVSRVNAELQGAFTRTRLKVQRWQLDTVTPAARPVPAELASLLQQARAAARELDYAQAVQLYNAAIDALDKRLVELGDAQTLADTYVALAGVYLGMEEPAFIATALSRAASLRPGMDLDPRRFPPALVAAFADAKARVLAEPAAKIAVEVTPTGTPIYLDGLLVGETPATLDVRKGPHLLQIVPEGHAAFAKRVEAVAGGMIKLNDALARPKSYELVDALTLELSSQNRRTEALGIARTLAAQVKADAALLIGIAPIKGGYGLFATLTCEPPQSIVGVSDVSLGKLGVILASMANRLAAASEQSTRVPVEIVSMGEPGVSLQGLNVAFDEQLLGLSPPSAATVAAMGPGTGVAGLTERPPTETTSIWVSPWLWTGVAAVVIGGSVLTYVLLNNKKVVTVQDPSALRVSVGTLP